MDEDTTDAAWHQLQLEEERRQWDEWLNEDPGYFLWLDTLNAIGENECLPE